MSKPVACLQCGEALLITERGVPVAKFEPLSWETDAEAMLEVLYGSGVVRPPVAELPEEFFE